MCFKPAVSLGQFKIKINGLVWNKFPVHNIQLQYPSKILHFVYLLIQLLLVFYNNCGYYLFFHFSSFLILFILLLCLSLPLKGVFNQIEVIFFVFSNGKILPLKPNTFASLCNLDIFAE